MHKSVVILSILFFGFDLTAGENYRKSEARAVAALDLIPGRLHEDFVGFPDKKNKRGSFDSARSVKFGLEKYLLKQCQKLERQNRLLERENDVLRSKLAVSPGELSKTGESSDSSRLSFNGGGASSLVASSSSVSPMRLKALSHNKLSQATSPITITRPSSLSMEERYNYIESPCGSSRLEYYAPASFPNDGSSLLSLSTAKKISPLAPFYQDCP